MKTIQSFAGANIYSHRAAVVLHLDSGFFEEKKSNEFPRFNKILLELLPGLAEHFCGSGAPRDFTERLNQGMHFNHVIKHVAIELMRLAGAELRGASICDDGEKNVAKAIIETTRLATARFLLPFAAELVEAALIGKTLNIEEKIGDAKRIARGEEFDSSTTLIVEAAEKLGVPWFSQDERGLIQLGYGANLRLWRAGLTDGTGAIAVETASDENLTIQRLSNFFIPAPARKIVGSEEEAVEALDALGAPIVVKSLGGQHENGAAFNVNTREEVVAAFRIAEKYAAQVSIEEQFEGKNYGVLIVGGKVIAAGERISGGDSDDENHEMRDVTDETHRSVESLCARAARVIGLDVCEINFIAKDISAPLPTKRAGIVRINARPEIQKYAFSNRGKPRDIGGAIIEMLYPNGKPARIPIISVTGTNGKTSVTRMISRVLSETNLGVGATTSTGIYLNGELIARGDMTGPKSARAILGDPAVDIAVLETARGGIVRRGLGYDWSDVAVYTNIGEDHIGQDGIESVADLIRIKALVAERLRTGGTFVVNADDENSLSVLKRENVRRISKEIVYFSFDDENPPVLEHLAGGGTAYFQKDGFIVESVGREEFPIVKIDEIPATLGGTAEFQIANAMAAIAACRAVNVSREQCAAGLAAFRSDANNPGRNNLYKVGAGYVLVDYGHNTDGFAAVCRMARRWTGKTVTGIIGLPGDRDNRIIEEAARVAARGFDRVIVTEEVNRRGREPGEMANLLCDAIKREKSDKDCEIVLDEIAAFSKAVAEMRENEVVVIFYRQLDLILEILAQNRGVPVSSFEETERVN